METLLYILAAPRFLLKLLAVVVGVVLVSYGTRETYRRYRGEKSARFNAASLAFLGLCVTAVFMVRLTWEQIGDVLTGEHEPSKGATRDEMMRECQRREARIRLEAAAKGSRAWTFDEAACMAEQRAQ